MEASPIPHVEIESFLNLHGYRQFDVRLFIAEIICRLDDNWRSSGSKTKTTEEDEDA